jgi:phosphoglycerate dehydrogenase-like enzyme
MSEKPRVAVLSRAGMPDQIAHLDDRVDLAVCTEEGLADELTRCDVLLLWDFFSRAVRPSWSDRATVRWIHVPAAGVDKMLFDQLIDSDVVVTNARGTFDRPIAEYVLGLVLRHYKQFGLTQRLQETRDWRHREPRTIAGSTALVIGTGPIGRATAALLRASGMRVTASGRTRREDPELGTVLATEDLPEQIGGFDVVVLLAPLTDQTRGLMSADLLARMRRGSYLINVGRGELLDQNALEAMLRSGLGPLAGAALDAFDDEPLAPDSSLWTVPGLFVSPHMSGDDVGWRDRLAVQFIDNLDRWLAGEPLVNVVDKHLGYIPGAT